MELLETLKQARDAMKQVDSRPNGLWNIKTELSNLTTAIEQLEKAEPVCWWNFKYPTLPIQLTRPMDGGSWQPLYSHPSTPGEKK